MKSQLKKTQQLNDTLTDLSFTQSLLEASIDKHAYALFGQLFIGNKDSYSDFQRKLNQARIPLSHDVYLSRVLFYSIFSLIVGTLLSVTVPLIIQNYAVYLFEGISGMETVSTAVSIKPVVVVGLISFLIFGLGGFIITFLCFILYPMYIANERKRKININLPFATTFMYAMSRGGVTIIDVIKTVAEAEDTYGQVSVEFQGIANSTHYSTNDLRSAIKNEIDITPSAKLSEFLEDLINIIDTGSDMDTFFLNRSETYIEESKEEQKQILDQLEVMSEIYIVLFVASPIFVLVINVVMLFLGASNANILYALAYLVIPLGGGVFIAIVWIISESQTESVSKLDNTDDHIFIENSYDLEAANADERYSQYRKQKLRKWLKQGLVDSYKIIIERPVYTFIFTIPAAIVAVVFLQENTIAELTHSAFIQNPETNSLYLLYIPGLIAMIPFVILYELQQRNKRVVLRRIPEAFSTAAEANSRGLMLSDSFDVVANNSTDYLSSKLQVAINESRWTNSFERALIRFANDIEVSRLSRTIKLVTKANKLTGDIQAVLEIAAKDLKLMAELDAERVKQSYMQIVVIFVSYFISVCIIVSLEIMFIQMLGDSAFQTGSGELDTLGGINTGIRQEINLILLHIAMALGVTSGIVGSTMANNDPLKGIKFALILSGIGLFAFLIV